MVRSAIDSVDMDLILPMLSVVDQGRHKYTIPCLDHDRPEFYWIFRNLDFKQWNNPRCSQVLWLSGPPERNIDQVSSYIVDLEEKTALKTEHIVLYFFCSSVSTNESIVDVFFHTLLYEIVRYLPMNEKTTVVKSFLLTLHEQAFKTATSPSWKTRQLNEEDPPDKKIKKLLKAPTNQLCAALEAALGYLHKREISIIVDGLDKKKIELIMGVRAFIKCLQQRTPKAKILLTSRAQAEIKEVLSEFPCIEYDKERKG